MNHKNPNRMADGIIFVICIFGLIGLSFEMGYQWGKTHGQAIKVCAVVPGQQVVSTTEDTCTYANSFGRATTKRKAI